MERAVTRKRAQEEPQERQERQEPAEPAEPRREKRERREKYACSGLRERPRFAFVSCFDEVDRLVEVDLEILKPFGTVLYKHIVYDQPYKISTGPCAGKVYWKTTMTRAMLTTLMRSLLHGELSLGKGVSIQEALTTFEFENITVGVPAHKQAEIKGLRNISDGVINPKRDQTVSSIILQMCEQVAHAISKWPRLESVLDAAVSGGLVNVSCTPTRCWVRLAAKPQPFLVRDRSHGVDYLTELARRWPRWLAMVMTSIGIIHYRLVKDGTLSKEARDAAAYSKLADAIDADASGPWWCVLLDNTKSIHNGSQKVSRELVKGERLANDIRSCIVESTVSAGSIAAHFTPAPAPTPFPSSTAASNSNQTAEEARGPGIFGATGVAQPRENLQFSRAVVALADRLIQSMPSLACVLSGACVDDAAKSSERTQLTKSLKTRGINIIRWTNDAEKNVFPLTFPHIFADAGNGNRPTGVCILLDFSAIR